MSAEQKPYYGSPRVESCIADVMKRFPGASASSQARYFEEVHQHLAPLARQLEHELAEAKASAQAAWDQLAAKRSTPAVTGEAGGDGLIQEDIFCLAEAEFGRANAMTLYAGHSLLLNIERLTSFANAAVKAAGQDSLPRDQILKLRDDEGRIYDTIRHLTDQAAEHFAKAVIAAAGQGGEDAK